MSGIEFTLTDEQMRQTLGAALLANMTGEEKDRVIAQAIEYLTTPEKSGFGSARKSPMQIAFNNAMEQATFVWAREFIQNDPAILGAVNKVLAESTKALIEEREDFLRVVTNGLGRAIAESLKEGGY
jgi:hypothetical protein